MPPADIEPDCYLKPSTQAFSLRIPTVGEVPNLLRKLDVRKATRLDKIPCKLLKVAADIVAPSLTKIYQPSIITGIFPSEWKLARVTSIFKKGKINNPCNYRRISVIRGGSRGGVRGCARPLRFSQISYILPQNNNNNNNMGRGWSYFLVVHPLLTKILDPPLVIPTVSAIFEKVVHEQLYNYLSEKNLLPSC